jgi:hypothetical protein
MEARKVLADVHLDSSTELDHPIGRFPGSILTVGLRALGTAWIVQVTAMDCMGGVGKRMGEEWS